MESTSVTHKVLAMLSAFDVDHSVLSLIERARRSGSASPPAVVVDLPVEGLGVDEGHGCLGLSFTSS
ncbi:hypothetical protein V3N99_04435 [Dermatophilaceae bacterium Soc4.6]